MFTPYMACHSTRAVVSAVSSEPLLLTWDMCSVRAFGSLEPLVLVCFGDFTMVQRFCLLHGCFGDPLIGQRLKTNLYAGLES